MITNVKAVSCNQILVLVEFESLELFLTILCLFVFLIRLLESKYCVLHPRPPKLRTLLGKNLWPPSKFGIRLSFWKLGLEFSNKAC